MLISKLIYPGTFLLKPTFYKGMSFTLGKIRVNNTFNLKYIITRLTGRFAPIFYINCEHFLVVYFVKQKQKDFRGLYKKFRGFLKMTIIFVRGKFLKIRPSILNLPWGHARPHKKKFCSISSLFFFNTKKQTGRQVYTYRVCFLFQL